MFSSSIYEMERLSGFTSFENDGLMQMHKMDSPGIEIKMVYQVKIMERCTKYCREHSR